jgi:hypothetical protein
MEGAFHHSRLDRTSTGGNLACLVMLGKDLL